MYSQLGSKLYNVTSRLYFIYQDYNLIGATHNRDVRPCIHNITDWAIAFKGFSHWN